MISLPKRSSPLLAASLITITITIRRLGKFCPHSSFCTVSHPPPCTGHASFKTKGVCLISADLLGHGGTDMPIWASRNDHPHLPPLGAHASSCVSPSPSASPHSYSSPMATPTKTPPRPSIPSNCVLIAI